MTAIRKIDLTPITSEALAAYGYDPDTRRLGVQFPRTGAIWYYADVPVDVALAFSQAESKGRFFASAMRGKFHAERMTGPCAKCGAEGFIGETCGDCGTAEHQAVNRDK